MTITRHYIVAFLLIFAQLLLAVLIEFGHNGVDDVLPSSREVLCPHRCGAHEIHRPLDQIGYCQACAYSIQRLAPEPSGQPAEPCAGLVRTPALPFAQPGPQTYLYHYGMRAPPFFAL